MEASSYRIVVRGQLSDRFAAAFDEMTAESGGSETTLVGLIRDQAHLYGVLEHLRDFGLELVRVEEASDAHQVRSSDRSS